MAKRYGAHEAFGRAFAAACAATGLTQGDIARGAGVHPVSMSRWTMGRRLPGAAEWQRLVAVIRAAGADPAPVLDVLRADLVRPYDISPV